MKIKLTSHNFLNFYIPMFLVLSPYRILGLSNVFLYILLFFSFYLFILKKPKFIINKYLLLFSFSYISISFLNNIIIYNNITSTDLSNVVMPCLMLFIIGTCTSFINKDKLFKWYSIIGLFAILIIFYQSFFLYILGIQKPPFNLLPVSAIDAHYWGYFEGERPSSFFPEPQAYASFVLPLLIISFQKRKHFFSILIIVSILLSGSSQGILLVGLLCLFEIFKSSRLTLKILSLAIFTLGIIAFITLPAFDKSKEKITAIDLDNNIRLTRGFLIYSYFNDHQKLWGIGEGKQQEYVEKNLYNEPWVKVHADNPDKIGLLGYSTVLARILISSGIIPFFLFLLFIFKTYLHEDKNNRPLLILIIISSLSQTLLFNNWFLFYYLIYFGISEIKTNSINLIFKQKRHELQINDN